MSPLDLVKLTALMQRTGGRAEIMVGLIDGPVVVNHPDLVSENIREVPGKLSGACAQASNAACMHGTFVAGILCARRNSSAPAICPGCTLLVRPIFAETGVADGEMPCATAEELARRFSKYPLSGRVKWVPLGGLVGFGSDILCLRQNLN